MNPSKTITRKNFKEKRQGSAYLEGFKLSLSLTTGQSGTNSHHDLTAGLAYIYIR